MLRKTEDHYNGDPSEIGNVPLFADFVLPHYDRVCHVLGLPGSLWDKAVITALSNNVSSFWAEFGVFKGMSARYFLSRLPKDGRMYLFDSFEGLPEEWGSHPVGYFFVDKIPQFNDDRAIIKKGWFEDTLPLDEPLGLVNIDCDLYSSAKTVLGGINVVPGSVILFDELWGYDGWRDDEYRALMEWNREYRFLGRDGNSRVAIEVL
jgi:hypothetical protein